MGQIRHKWTERQLALIFLSGEGLCHICGGRIEGWDTWEAEHVIALGIGGADRIENMRPAHKSPCHEDKTRDDRKRIAKVNRIRKKIDGAREKRRVRKIPSRPFPKTHRPMRGNKC